MERAAFARALRFLNYNGAAKWGALVAGLGTAVLFFLLLLLLALFTDLVVTRGAIPCFRNLPLRERIAFLNSLGIPEDQAPRQEYTRALMEKFAALGLQDPALAKLLLAGDLENDRDFRRGLAWFVELPGIVRDLAGEEAYRQVLGALQRRFAAGTPREAVLRDLEDFGLLSLAVRTRHGPQGWFVRPTLRLNGWMWVDGNLAYLQGLFLVALALGTIRAGLWYLSNSLAARAVLEAVTRMRRALYHHTYRLGTLAFRALGPSEAVGISTRHLESIHDGLFAWLTVVFREPVKFGLLLIFAMLVDFWLALAFLLFAVLVWLIGGQIASHFRRRGRAADLQAANQLVLLQESLMMMRLVKVYLMENFNQARVERLFARYAQAHLVRQRGDAIYKPLFVWLGLIAALVLLFLAGLVILSGNLGVTSAMVLAAALICLYWPVIAVLENRRLLRRSRQSAAVLFAFLDRPGGLGQDLGAEFLPTLSKQLDYHGVSLKEPGTGRKLLQGVTLHLKAGEKVALVGPDEMEKHSLVYLLPRFLDPDAGEIRIDRKDLRGVTLDSLRVQIAMVLQHNLVFNDTVANNIGCGDPGYNLPKIIEAAKVAHAHQFIQKLPQGYETPIGEMGHYLDGSQQFRIALARAILRDPAILVIEEPSVPMSEEAKNLVDDTYARVLPGRTVIFLPHRLSTIRRCDRIYLLHQGKIEAAGDHRELLASNELYRHLQYMEFNEFASLFQGNAVSPRDGTAT